MSKTAIVSLMAIVSGASALAYVLTNSKVHQGTLNRPAVYERRMEATADTVSLGKGAAPQDLRASTMPGDQETMVTVDWPRMRVSVKDQQLLWVINTVAQQSGIAINVDSSVADRAISIDLPDVTVESGLKDLLAGLDSYFYFGADGTTPSRLTAVWVYPKGRGRTVPPVAGRENIEGSNKGAKQAALGPSASTAEVQSQLSDSSAFVRAEAIGKLIERDGDEAMPVVVEALEDGDELVRGAALQHAISHNLHIADSVLRDVATLDQSPLMRIAALGAFAERYAASENDTRELRDIASDALMDPEAQVREYAQEIINQLDRRETGGAPDGPQSSQGGGAVTDAVDAS